jgi:hypothetical protein
MPWRLSDSAGRGVENRFPSTAFWLTIQENAGLGEAHVRELA